MTPEENIENMEQNAEPIVEQIANVENETPVVKDNDEILNREYFFEHRFRFWPRHFLLETR